MRSLIDDASGGLVVGAVITSVALGQTLVRHDFFRKVASEPTHFPIILKPYRWMMVFSHVICAGWFLGTLGIMAFSSGVGSKILGAVSILVLIPLCYSVFRGARQFIRIDSDGFSYVKGGSSSVDVKARFVERFFAPAVGGNLVIVIKYQRRRVLIPIMFRNINLLNYVLTRWRTENWKRESAQQDLRSRTLSGSSGD